MPKVTEISTWEEVPKFRGTREMLEDDNKDEEKAQWCSLASPRRARRKCWEEASTPSRPPRSGCSSMNHEALMQCMEGSKKRVILCQTWMFHMKGVACPAPQHKDDGMIHLCISGTLIVSACLQSSIMHNHVCTLIYPKD